MEKEPVPDLQAMDLESKLPEYRPSFKPGLQRLVVDILRSDLTPVVVTKSEGEELQRYHPELDEKGSNPHDYKPEENQNVLGSPLVIPIDF